MSEKKNTKFEDWLNRDNARFHLLPVDNAPENDAYSQPELNRSSEVKQFKLPQFEGIRNFFKGISTRIQKRLDQRNVTEVDPEKYPHLKYHRGEKRTYYDRPDN